jgi:GNAT superfamily N-acetyltransferase
MNYLPINIRVADRNDLEIILNFILEKAQFDGEEHAVQASLNKLDKTLFGNRPLAYVLLAEVESHPVGFALFFYTYSSFLAQPGIWLDDLFVQPQMRHQGIGTALIKHLINRAKTEECGRIEWTVAVDNHLAIDFYQQQGAEILQQVRVCRLEQETISKT